MLGTVAPSVFIDVAEQSGLIDGIGLRVLHAACNEAMRWANIGDGGERLFVSVNVSPRQLRKGDLPEIVAECLRETGLPASCLHLELTETAVISDELQAATMLARLHSTGVKVWLDDFGTGFSALSYLHRFPISALKIDRSFVAGLHADNGKSTQALVEGVVSLARTLGIETIGEGVEDERQLRTLFDMGCNFGQGYLLGHPLPREATLYRMA